MGGVGEDRERRESGGVLTIPFFLFSTCSMIRKGLGCGKKEVKEMSEIGMENVGKRDGWRCKGEYENRIKDGRRNGPIVIQYYK